MGPQTENPEHTVVAKKVAYSSSVAKFRGTFPRGSMAEAQTWTMGASRVIPRYRGAAEVFNIPARGEAPNDRGAHNDVSPKETRLTSKALFVRATAATRPALLPCATQQ